MNISVDLKAKDRSAPVGREGHPISWVLPPIACQRRENRGQCRGLGPASLGGPRQSWQSRRVCERLAARLSEGASDDWGLSTFLPSDVTDKVPGEKLAVGGTDQNKEVTSVCEATLPATGTLELYSLLPAQRAGDRCGRFLPPLRTIRRPAGKMCKRWGLDLEAFFLSFFFFLAASGLSCGRWASLPAGMWEAS